MEWMARYRTNLLGGAGLGAMIGVSASWYAGTHHLRLWPTVVTWLEWAAAILLFPMLLAALFGLARRSEVMRDKVDRVLDVVAQLRMVGAVLFITALVLRALFGLGWKPF